MGGAGTGCLCFTEQHEQSKGRTHCLHLRSHRLSQQHFVNAGEESPSPAWQGMASHSRTDRRALLQSHCGSHCLPTLHGPTPPSLASLSLTHLTVLRGQLTTPESPKTPLSFTAPPQEGSTCLLPACTEHPFFTGYVLGTQQLPPSLVLSP